MNLTNRTALITGAGSGIGRALAISLSKKSCHLILTDINEAGLKETRSLCSQSGVKVSSHRVDVGSREEINSFAKIISEINPKLDLLINNAGVAAGGSFEQTSEEDFELLMNVNFYGPVRMCRAFLPMLHQSDEARIVNVSSIYGIIAPPGQTAYSSSKFAVRGFSHSLAHELQKTKIGVTVVHPGGVATSIVQNARIPAGATEEQVARNRKRHEKSLVLSPEKAAQIIVAGIEKRKTRILVGKDARAAALMERLFPVMYWKIVGLIAPG